MPTPLTEREKDSFFYYVDAAGRACVRVQIPIDGTVLVQHKAPNRHWKGGWPEGLKLPYRYRELVAASPDQLVYVVADEREAEHLIRGKRVATVIRFPTADAKQADDWLQSFRGKRVLIVPNTSAQGFLQAARLLALLMDHAAWVMDVQLDGLDVGEGLYEWLERRNFDLTELDDYVYRLTDAREKANRPTVHRGPAREPAIAAGPPGPAGDDEDDDLAEGWQPLPLDTLPDIIARYAEAGAKALPCDPSLFAIPALISCAGLIGNTRFMSIKDSWPEPSILWGVAVATPSSKKSAAYRLVNKAVERLDTELVEDNARQLEVYEDELGGWEARNGRSKGGEAGGPSDRRPKRPDSRRLLVSDITVETAIRELQKNPRGLTLLRDELGGWFQSFGRYSATGSGSADVSFWTEAYEGGRYRYDRKSGDGTSIVIQRCSVSVYGTIQPEAMQRIFTRPFFDTGFAYRFLFCLPPKVRSRWTDAIIPVDVRADYQALTRALFELDRDLVNDPGWEPRPMVFDEEGNRAWIYHHDELEALIDDAQGDTERLLNKLKATVARLALVFGVIDSVVHEGRAAVVTKDHVSRAARLTKWFFNEIQRVYSLIHMAPDQLEVQQLVEWIKARGGTTTARELFKSNKSRFGNTAEARLALDRLAVKNVGTWSERRSTPTGGRPTHYFSLYGRNPETLLPRNGAY